MPIYKSTWKSTIPLSGLIDLRFKDQIHRHKLENRNINKTISLCRLYKKLAPRISKKKKGRYYYIDTEREKHELVINGINNLEIIGKSVEPTKIITTNLRSEVIKFENSNNIKIRNRNTL